MKILVTYDVNTETAAGKKRLRKVARICENYGVRVQNSVFECVLNAVEFLQLKTELTKWIDIDKDSLRFYNLGNKYETKVEHIGTKEAVQVEKPLIL